MSLVGFEPTISAGERPQTYALDRAATGTGRQNIKLNWHINGNFCVAKPFRILQIRLWSSSVWYIDPLVDKLKLMDSSWQLANYGSSTTVNFEVSDMASLNDVMLQFLSMCHKPCRRKHFHNGSSTFPLLRMSLYKENAAVYIMCITIPIITVFVTIYLLKLIQCCWIGVHCYYIFILPTETGSRYVYVTHWN